MSARHRFAIAVAMPGDDRETDAYDEGRVAERILIAAGAMDLGAGIGWAEEGQWPAIGELLGVVPPAFVRTVVSLGHPTEQARRPRTGPARADGRSRSSSGSASGLVRSRRCRKNAPEEIGAFLVTTEVR